MMHIVREGTGSRRGSVWCVFVAHGVGRQEYRCARKSQCGRTTGLPVISTGERRAEAPDLRSVPRFLVAAVVVVAGVIGISGIYPQIIDSEWVQGTSPRSQRFAPSETARSETAPTPRRSGIVAEIPLPPRRVAVTTGEAAAPAAPAAPAVRTAATAPAPAVPSPTRVAAAPAPAASAPAAPAPASPPALTEMRPSVAAAQQPAADPDAALADTDAQAKADPPADPAAAPLPLPPLLRQPPRGRPTLPGSRW